MKPILFEEKKFCQVRTLAQRWDCSVERILELCSKGVLQLWHPEGKTGAKGRLIAVEGVLRAEQSGWIQIY